MPVAIRSFDKSRFGLYLVPPYEIARELALIKLVLKREFGLEAAARFQEHATIKGFFKFINNRTVEELISELDPFLRKQEGFHLKVSDELRIDEGIGYNLEVVNPTPDETFYNFREQVIEILTPFISEDCDFLADDLEHEFEPHFTLAFHDIPESLFESIVAYLKGTLPLVTKPFRATTLQLVAYHSSKWEGEWWTDLSWTPIHQWTLD